MFENSWPSASNFKRFSWSLEHFFLTEGRNNFGNKIPFFFSSSIWCVLGCWRCLWKFSIRNSFRFFGLLWNLYSLWFLFSDCHNLLVICQRAYSKSYHSEIWQQIETFEENICGFCQRWGCIYTFWFSPLSTFFTLEFRV